MIRRAALLVAIVAIPSLSVAQTKKGAAAPQKAEYEKTLPAALASKAKIAEPAAATTALAKVPGGKIRAVDLDSVAGKLVYSYDIKVKGKKGSEEVNIDAMSGQVVAAKHEKKKQKLAEDSAKAAKKAPAAPPKKP